MVSNVGPGKYIAEKSGSKTYISSDDLKKSHAKIQYGKGKPKPVNIDALKRYADKDKDGVSGREFDNRMKYLSTRSDYGNKITVYVEGKGQYVYQNGKLIKSPDQKKEPLKKHAKKIDKEVVKGGANKEEMVEEIYNKELKFWAKEEGISLSKLKNFKFSINGPVDRAVSSMAIKDYINIIADVYPEGISKNLLKNILNKRFPECKCDQLVDNMFKNDNISASDLKNFSSNEIKLAMEGNKLYKTKEYAKTKKSKTAPVKEKAVISKAEIYTEEIIKGGNIHNSKEGMLKSAYLIKTYINILSQMGEIRKRYLKKLLKTKFPDWKTDKIVDELYGGSDQNIISKATLSKTSEDDIYFAIRVGVFNIKEPNLPKESDTSQYYSKSTDKKSEKAYKSEYKKPEYKYTKYDPYEDIPWYIKWFSSGDHLASKASNYRARKNN